MSNYKLSDFKVGQTAYIELTGNAVRRHKKEDLILECTVEKVGRKFVTAYDGMKFEEHTGSYGGLIEHTNYCVDYVLYPNRQALEEKFERKQLLLDIELAFIGAKGNTMDIEKLRKIMEIINN